MGLGGTDELSGETVTGIRLGQPPTCTAGRLNSERYRLRTGTQQHGFSSGYSAR